MKKTRLILAVVLIIALSASVAFSVYAHGTTDCNTVLEDSYWCNDLINCSESNAELNTSGGKDNGASTRGTCDKCYGGSEPVCLGNLILMEEGYHSLGMLGLITTKCYAFCYGSYGVERCYECGNILWTYDELHMCFQKHMKCNKGDYDVCYMVKD